MIRPLAGDSVPATGSSYQVRTPDATVNLCFVEPDRPSSGPPNQFLKAENEILRARLGPEIHTRPEERRRLLKFGLTLGPAVKDLISIVSYQTFQRWVRTQLKNGATEAHLGQLPRGRQLKPEEIEQLIVRLAQENDWGYSRILAELKKLRIKKICRSTVKNLLKRNNLDPEPQRSPGTWDHFVLFFLEVGSRKIRFWNLTSHPTGVR